MRIREGADEFGRFVKGNKGGPGQTKIEHQVHAVIPSIFCAHCGKVVYCFQIGGHYAKCKEDKPKETIDKLYAEYKAGPRWARSLHNREGAKPMMTRDDFLQALSDIVEERYQPAINSAINNLSRHFRLGEDGKPTGEEAFGGFIFAVAKAPEKKD